MGLTLLITQKQLRQLRKRLLLGNLREIGGWLVAEELAPGKFELVGMTVDYTSGNLSHFVNRPEKHDAKFEQIRTRHSGRKGRVEYLGEWHSHPAHKALPSDMDVRSMTEMVERNGPPFAVLLIVRLGAWFSVETSLTLFQRGEPPAAAELIAYTKDNTNG